MTKTHKVDISKADYNKDKEKKERKSILAHLCFKQAQLKMCHSPKVDDGLDNFFQNFLKTYFRTFFFKEL